MMSSVIETFPAGGSEPEPQGALSAEQRIIAGAEGLGLVPTEDELTALAGMLRAEPAGSPDEVELRFDIVSARHRAETKRSHDPRHIALFGLLKNLQREDED